jgi:hypothetical protein
MQHFLVSVAGYSSYVNPSNASVTLGITLPNHRTVPEWFSRGQKFYFRTEMRATTLLGFWACSKEDVERVNKQ